MELSNPRNIQIQDFSYNLPDKRIAKYPFDKRDASKLLIYKDCKVIDDKFSSITQYLPKDSLLVFNNTRVIQARLYFRKPTGASIEIFCLDPYSPKDYNLIFQSTKNCAWHCMIGNLKKWKEGDLNNDIEIAGSIVRLTATKIESEGDHHIVQFSWNNTQFTFSDILDVVGELPIPPYLNRNTEDKDKDVYQTLYSKIKGSVAAPTAGLHFTEDVFSEIGRRGIKTDEVTLHVGAGTFRPVKSKTIDGHNMHSEFISVKKQLIENLLEHQGDVVAVGTTSVRTLESLYYIGSELEKDSNLNDLKVLQWQPYINENNLISKEKALQNILGYLDKRDIDVLLANTQIMIVPGYKFKIVDAMVTNFHQPQSTLLLLVSAFTKGEWRSIYTHALAHNYRFLSYGDSSLLFR